MTKILLRHGRTGYYYNGNSEWVAIEADAKNYDSIDAALEAAAEGKLDGMSLVIRYDKSGKEQEFFLGKGAPGAEVKEWFKKLEI
jgi:hypothetical protein